MWVSVLAHITTTELPELSDLNFIQQALIFSTQIRTNRCGLIQGCQSNCSAPFICLSFKTALLVHIQGVIEKSLAAVCGEVGLHARSETCVLHPTEYLALICYQAPTSTGWSRPRNNCSSLTDHWGLAPEASKSPLTPMLKCPTLQQK